MNPDMACGTPDRRTGKERRDEDVMFMPIEIGKENINGIEASVEELLSNRRAYKERRGQVTAEQLADWMIERIKQQRHIASMMVEDAQAILYFIREKEGRK